MPYKISCQRRYTMEIFLFYRENLQVDQCGKECQLNRAKPREVKKQLLKS